MRANCVDHEQTPRSLASDLGLHCLPRPHKKDASFSGIKLYEVKLSLSIEMQFAKPP